MLSNVWMNTLSSMIGAQHASIIIPIIVLTSFIVYCPTRFVQKRPIKVYSYFEKGCRKNLHATIPKDNMGYDQYTVPDTVAVEPTFFAFLWHSQTYILGPSCHSFKFLWRTVNHKPPTIPFGIVACTFSDNISQKRCKLNKNYHSSV